MGIFFGDKQPIVTACEKSIEQQETLSRKVFQEVYLLTHPYYQLMGNEDYFEQYHRILLLSISAIRKRGLRTLGMLTLEGDEKFEFGRNNPIQKYLHETLRRMQEILGENLHVRIQTGGYYEKGMHDLPLQFERGVFLSARGIWGNRCVLTTLEDFTNVHRVPEERALLITGESLLPNRDNFPHPQSGVISIAELRKLGKLRIGHPISD